MVNLFVMVAVSMAAFAFPSRIKGEFPEVRSVALRAYLGALAETFGAALPRPRPRFRFFVPATLNASVWPLGEGHFAVHAGLFMYGNDEVLSFLISLTMAHESLGHHRGLSTREDYRRRELGPWALLVEGDPVEQSGFSYSVRQEIEALDLVDRAGLGLGRESGARAADVILFLGELGRYRGYSSLPRLHANLKQAIQGRYARPSLAVVSRTARDVGLASARAELRAEGLQDYQWMREALASNKGERAASFMRGLEHLAARRWNDALATSTKALQSQPASEPFLWIQLLSLRQLGRLRECTRRSGVAWRRFPHLRDLIGAQCLFLDGRYTEAARALVAYRQKFPLDVEGAFWQGLVDLKMRRSAGRDFAAFERLWGDRPYLRALKALELGFLGKPTEAARAIVFSSQTSYSDGEWGTLELARAWLVEEYSPYRERDEKAEVLRKRADLRWPLSEAVLHQLRRRQVDES